MNDIRTALRISSVKLFILTMNCAMADGTLSSFRFSINFPLLSFLAVRKLVIIMFISRAKLTSKFRESADDHRRKVKHVCEFDDDNVEWDQMLRKNVICVVKCGSKVDDSSHHH